LRFARMNNIPLYGINVEQTLKKKVKEKGWFNISKSERDGIRNPASPSDAYLEMLASTYSLHGHHGASTDGKKSKELDLDKLKKDSGFQRFVQGQQLWDRAMAHGIETLVKAEPKRQVVAIMGSGHIMNGFGVPHQLADLGVKNVATLIPWEQEYECEMLTSDFASAVYGMPTLPKNGFSGKQKLGVHIEPAKKGVKISRVIDESLAQAAGLVAGDILVEMAGIKIKRVIEVIDIVRKMQAGTWLPIVVLRGDDKMNIVAKFPLIKVE
ncbi:MAG: PDZ domain-containing protein, partial [Gammaproteobacteria bacterium]|nr:PDZ domain-containing protein [Gammaproteobacteria bacterium]